MGRVALPCLLVAACGFEPPSGPGPGLEPDAGAVIADAPAGSDAAAAVCVDANADGACDDQTWRCGAVPEEPSANPLWGDVLREAWWSHDATLGGQGRRVVAAPGGTLALDFDFDWRVDCDSGASCPAQLEVGLVSASASHFVGCVIDKTVVDRDIEWDHDGMAMIAVPAVPAIYEVRLRIGKQAACGAQLSGQTSESQVIAKICVPPP